MTNRTGPWIVDIVLNDGADMIKGSEPIENDELVGLLNNVGEPNGAMGVMNEDGVFVFVPASRVLEVHAREVGKDD